MDEQNPVQAKRVLIRSLIRQLSVVLDRTPQLSSPPIRRPQSGTYVNNRDTSLDLRPGINEIDNDAGPVDLSVIELMRSLSTEDQSIFITLHYLLPSTFIPALDLLDKGVIEFIEPHFSGSKKGEQDGIGPVGMFRIARSLEDFDRSYERVRTGTWTCSCVQFFKHAVKISEVADLLDLGPTEYEDFVPASLPDEIDESACGTEDDWFLQVGECAHVVACYVAMCCGDKVKEFVKNVNAGTPDKWLEMCGIGSVSHPTHPMPI
ncbi:hypothetical protein V1508DRAFT_413318 [Lipomyces doorenjongii]|uniref:uncharacterized protein n=1 Tax=Lipomyces doorenjongii TaxID=383834 RepID=UPI0034CDD6D7